MENLSDTNKTAGINVCQGMFVNFVPDVYPQRWSKKGNQAASQKKAWKDTFGIRAG